MEKEETEGRAQVAEGRATEVEKQVGALKAGKLEAESKLLEVEVAHASCKAHIADLLRSVVKKERALKEWEDAWRVDRKKMLDDVADAFNAGVDQMKAYLQEIHQALGVNWGAISLDDILTVGEAVGGEGGEEKTSAGGSETMEEVGGGDADGAEVEEGGEKGGMTKSGGVIIKEID